MKLFTVATVIFFAVAVVMFVVPQKVVLCFRLMLSDGGSLFRYRNRINALFNLFRKNSESISKGPKTLGKT